MAELLEALQSWPDVDLEALRGRPEWEQARAWGWVMESGSRRLDALNGVAVSEQTDPQSIIEKRIAEAREENDFVTASRLQQQWEKRYGRGD